MSFFIAKILNLFENMPFRIIKKMGMSHLMALAIVSVMPPFVNSLNPKFLILLSSFFLLSLELTYCIFGAFKLEY